MYTTKVYTLGKRCHYTKQLIDVNKLREKAVFLNLFSKQLFKPLQLFSLQLLRQVNHIRQMRLNKQQLKAWN